MKWRALIAVVLIPAQVMAQELAEPEEEPKRVQPADVKLDPPLQAIPAGEDKIVALGSGEAAPFSGQLFETNTAIRWGMWLQQWKLRYKTDMAMQLNTCAVEADHQATIATIEQERLLTINEDLTERLKESETERLEAEARVRDPGFWSSNGFYFGLGVVTTGAVVGLSTWALSASK